MALMPPAPGQASDGNKVDEPEGGAGKSDWARAASGSGQEAAARMDVERENAPPPAAVAVVHAGDGEGNTAHQLMRIPSSISKPKVVEHSKIKRKNVDLKTLWSRAKKKPNVQVEEQVDISSVQDQQHEQQVPSVQVQQQVQSSSPSIQIQQVPETEIESDIEDADYDVELLPRDPGKRRPIAEYEQLANLLNVLGMSCKKIRMLRLAQAERLIKALELEEIETGKGMNQEMGLSRPGDTRWGSHYKTIAHVLRMYPSIRFVLNKISKDRSQSNEAMLAQTMLSSFESFDFVFMAHLLQTIFGYTDFLSSALQQRDQDIVNAVELIDLTKIQLELLRNDDGWKPFLEEVTSFCVKNRVKVPQMEGPYKPVGRPSRFYKNLTNHHRFHVEMFLCLIDRQLRELGDRFDEVNTELLHYMGSFSPTDSFSAYHMPNLVKLAKLYPMDFSEDELIQLPYQLTLFIADVRRDERFKNLKNIVQLSILLVETNKSMTYNLVYKLLKLVLTLPVATASVERVFSSMTFVKNKLRNKMGNQLLNDCLVTYIEKEFFLQVKDEVVISRFQAMTDRMVVL